MAVFLVLSLQLRTKWYDASDVLSISHKKGDSANLNYDRFQTEDILNDFFDTGTAKTFRNGLQIHVSQPPCIMETFHC